MQIKINGIPFNLNDFDGTEGISFTYRRKTEDGDSGLSFSPELTVTGDAFTYLYSILVDVPAPELATATFDAYDECCDVDLFTGLIRGADVQWCEIDGCSMTISVVDNSEDAQALACLKNIFPWDRLPEFGSGPVTDGEDTFRTAPKTVYCVDLKPALLQEFVLIIGIIVTIILFPIAIIIGIIVTAINAIIAIVGGTPIGNGDINAIDDALFLFQEIQQYIVGCGYKHKTPFVHSYLQNICDICGLNLQSTAFNPGGWAHDTMRLDAAFKPGKQIDSRVLESYEFNKPNINGLQFLDDLKQFNFDWKISGSALIIERKDYFSGTTWIDTEVLSDNEIISLCFGSLDESPPAFAEYQYAKDGIDNTGDETNPDWVEKAIDWNIPVNPAQKGLYSRDFRYSTAQFRNDSGRDGVSPLDKPFYAVFLAALNDFQGAMLMERGLCGFPRLLMWDGNAVTVDEARILRYPSAIDTDVFDYNIDWWVKLNYAERNGTAHDTLYNRMLYIDDPRTTGIKRRPYTLVVTVNCNLVQGLGVSITDKLDKLNRLQKGGSYVTGTIEEITYNLSKGEITIQGKV